MDDPNHDDCLKRLVASHPLLLEGLEPLNSDLPRGWYHLVDRLCSDIETDLGPEITGRVKVWQIKEKFGTLRFYANLDGHARLHVDIIRNDGVEALIVEPTADASVPSLDSKAEERLWQLVDHACRASASICQDCGLAGTLRPLGWVQTLCDEHFEIKKRLARS